MVKMSYSLAWSLVQLYSCLAFRLTRLAGITASVRSVQDQEGVVGGAYDAGKIQCGGGEAEAGGGQAQGGGGGEAEAGGGQAHGGGGEAEAGG